MTPRVTLAPANSRFAGSCFGAMAYPRASETLLRSGIALSGVLVGVLVAATGVRVDGIGVGVSSAGVGPVVGNGVSVAAEVGLTAGAELP